MNILSFYFSNSLFCVVSDALIKKSADMFPRKENNILIVVLVQGRARSPAIICSVN